MYDNPLIPVTKNVLMVALQNLQYILIRGTDGPDVKFARYICFHLYYRLCCFHLKMLSLTDNYYYHCLCHLLL